MPSMKEISGEKLLVQSPYNSLFVEEAHKLNGRWVKPHWVFDARDEARVDALLSEFYGVDSAGVGDFCTLRIEWTDSGEGPPQGPIGVRGRTIATAHGRNSGAKLGEGVILLAGNFDSAGSTKNWVTAVASGTIVLVRDFPHAAALKLIATPHKTRAYSIEPEAKATEPRPVISEEEVRLTHKALLEERNAHMVRLAEIDRLLAVLTVRG